MNNHKQLLINCIDALVKLRAIFEFAPDQYKNELAIIDKALNGGGNDDNGETSRWVSNPANPASPLSSNATVDFPIINPINV